MNSNAKLGLVLARTAAILSANASALSRLDQSKPCPARAVGSRQRDRRGRGTFAMPAYVKLDFSLRECCACSSEYKPRKINQKYCSGDCRKQSNRSLFGTPKDQRPTSTTGAISELLAAAQLMQNGFEVFRALSPAASCDLLALKDGAFYKFEVKTSSKLRNGQWTYAKGRYGIRAENVVLVSHFGEVVLPEIKPTTPKHVEP